MNAFANKMPGMNKIFDRMFRRADDVIVWDLMSGKLGVRTEEGIATLDGEGDDAQVNINLMEEFSMPLPAFAQSTPKNGVQVGDVIVRGKGSIGWVVSKSEDGDKVKFKLMKPNGETVSWNPPKISLMGFESGVMVIRSLMTMLPGGAGDLSQLQGMLMPMMMFMGDDDGAAGDVMEKFMPMILMQMVNNQGNVGGGTNPMMGMMQMMMQMKMMEKMMGGRGSGSTQSAYDLNRSPFKGR